MKNAWIMWGIPSNLEHNEPLSFTLATDLEKEKLFNELSDDSLLQIEGLWKHSVDNIRKFGLKNLDIFTSTDTVVLFWELHWAVLTLKKVKPNVIWFNTTISQEAMQILENQPHSSVTIITWDNELETTLHKAVTMANLDICVTTDGILAFSK